MLKTIRVELLVKDSISVNKDNIINEVSDNSKFNRVKIQVKTAKFKNLVQSFLT